MDYLIPFLLLAIFAATLLLLGGFRFNFKKPIKKRNDKTKIVYVMDNGVLRKAVILNEHKKGAKWLTNVK